MRLIFEAMRANVREGRGRRHGGAMAQGEGAPMPYCGDGCQEEVLGERALVPRCGGATLHKVHTSIPQV